MDHLTNALVELDAANGSDAVLASARVIACARRLCNKRLREGEFTYTTSTLLGINIVTKRPFTFDGIRYITVQNAFQAQKAPSSQRINYSSCDPFDAVTMGRLCSIDVAKWDYGRRELMKSILMAQVKENPDMKRIVIDNVSNDIQEVMLMEPFWVREMPKIWKEIVVEIAAEIAAEEERSDDTEDDEEASQTKALSTGAAQFDDF